MSDNGEQIPPIAQEHVNQKDSSEFFALQSEAMYRQKLMQEIGQRILFRWIATIFALATGIVMFCMLISLIDKIFIGPAVVISPTLGIAIIVAPISSLTAIVVALLVGAFRKFDQKDVENLSSGTTGLAGIFGALKS